MFTILLSHYHVNRTIESTNTWPSYYNNAVVITTILFYAHYNASLCYFPMLILLLLHLFLFLTVDPPKITQHPENRSVVKGVDIDFNIKATGDNLNFQWQKDGSDLSDGEKYHGVHADTLHIVKVEDSDKGCYRCLVKNDVERKFSDEALLTDSKLVNAHNVSGYYKYHSLHLMHGAKL